MNGSRRGAAVLFLVAALAGCSPPTVADACRNVCACLTDCGLVGVAEPEATCEADGYAGEQQAESVGCAHAYARYVSCVYQVSCADLAQGCDDELGALNRCEGFDR